VQETKTKKVKFFIMRNIECYLI